MKNWKLNYFGSQLQKSTNKKYQLILTSLFLLDQELNEYQPKTEYVICNYRLDLYYEGSKIAIEIDEPHHLRSQDQDKIREEEIRRIIPDIKFYRIDISAHNWYSQYLEIKNEILKTGVKNWNESDIVDDFVLLESINIQKIGAQINAISKYLFGSYAIATAPERYSGVYINKDQNKLGNYYIAVVCYSEDVGESNAKISFVVFDSEAILTHSRDTKLYNQWVKTKKSIDCIIKYYEIDSNYLNNTKEEQFQKLKRFIIENFDSIHNINPKLNVNVHL